jgi:TolA-binding protein
VKKTTSAPIKVDRKAIEKLFNDGLDLYMAKKYKPALAEFSKIVALDPKNTRAKSYVKNLKNKLDRLKNL